MQNSVRNVLLVLMWGAISVTVLAQSTPTTVEPASDPQAVALIGAAENAVNGRGGGLALSDLTLNATASWFADGADHSGTAVLKVKGATQSRLDLVGDSSRSEIRNDSLIEAGQWIGVDGQRHWMAPHNCWVSAGALVPQALLQSTARVPGISAYIGRETLNGVAVDHIQFGRTFNFPDSFVNALAANLSRIQIYLDATSHLPVSVNFTQQLDNDLRRSIPVEIHFSDYRSVNGIFIPFRIERRIGAISLQLSVTDAQVNSGLRDSDFALE